MSFFKNILWKTFNIFSRSYPITPTPWIMEPGISMPHSQGLSYNPILSQINPIPRSNTYFLKIHSNIVVPTTPMPPLP